MKNILNSLLDWFNRLTYPQKFTVITLIYILPIIAFLPLAVDQNTYIDQYGRKEWFGTLYLRPLWQLTDALQKHQLISQQYAEGKSQFSEVETIQASIDDEFEKFERLHNDYRRSLQLGTEASELKAQWLELRDAVPTSSKADLDALHTDLLNRTIALTTHIGDVSYLILDPDLDTYYMMDTVLLKLPENQALIFEVYELAKATTARNFLTSNDQALFTILLSRVEENMSAMDRNISVALQNNRNGAMKPLVSAPLKDYQSAMKSYLDLIRTEVMNPSTDVGSPDTLDSRLESNYEQVHGANLAFYSKASTALETGVEARFNSLVLRLYSISAIVFLSVLAAFLLGRRIMNAISEPLVQLAEATKRLASGDMSARVSTETSDELGQVANAFNRMARELEADQETLVARARELESANQLSEKRSQKLQAISEISRIISSEQGLDILLPLVTRLVTEKFDFYHAGIFLLDDAREYAVLRAANSIGGRRMLARGHKLAIGKTGIVGYVTATGSPRITLDVGSDAAYFDNPDLPNTRSEVALPLRVADEIIGALDVQSTEPNAFNQEEVEALSILADQVAIAIRNARSYETTQELLKEAQQASGIYLGDSWNTFQLQGERVGYLMSENTVKTLSKPLTSAQIEKAITGKETVVESGRTSSLAVPIRLRDEVIGVVNIRIPEAHNWDPDEVDIAEAAAERLSLALESSLLLHATQRRAEIERLTADISGRIGSTTQFDSILRIAAQELSRVLGGSEVLVQIEPGALESGANT